MVGYAQSHQSADEPERYNEVIGSKVLADAFKEKGMLRGSFSINGIMLHNFESNGPDNLVALLNAKSEQTGVKAELTEDGHLKLSHEDASPIMLATGPAWHPPLGPNEKAPLELPPNTILADMGLEETPEPVPAEERSSG